MQLIGNVGENPKSQTFGRKESYPPLNYYMIITSPKGRKFSKSTAVILPDNHPNGNNRLSEADKQLTRKITKGGEYMGIIVLDHLILTPYGDYFSFADEGLV